MGDEQRSFDTVVEEEIKQINQYDEVKIDQYIGQSYLGRGLYAKQLDLIPLDNISGQQKVFPLLLHVLTITKSTY